MFLFSSSRPRLASSTFRSSELSEPLLRELHAFRLTFFRLKPDVSPESDFIAFRDHLLSSRCQTTVARAPDGQLAGFFCLSRHPHSDHLIFEIEYLFFARAYRGSSLVLTRLFWAFFFSLPALLLGRSFYFMGVGYPASFQSFSHSREYLFTLKSSDFPLKDRLRLFAFALDHGLDVASGVCPLRTLPDSRSHASAEYESLNPQWRDGFGLPFGYRFRLSSLPGIARQWLKRQLRSSR